ncbi:HPr family phosphocarrier protein [Candidatus Berkiella cookevillensis]|uniref:HPr family phosphocarrier protein n=1 Tax=Candidatus Berkiella cookevillensis TaxID=437022 RepID=A0A0Q9YBY1_9GAMM|nr:HPr family phosphocarrier protein [Candidatus Berkiella cookevillensis]MCS5709243.1 HPr family phosphocarrier protein [Candidatus Berkiella cookevillensis]
MIRKKIQIINKLGLHARAAAKFVQMAARFGSHIEVIKSGKTVNGKSIMGVMMLAASQNTWIELNINGEDEEEAMLALETLMNERFGEPR